MQDSKPFHLIGFIILSLFFGIVVTLLFMPYFEISFLRIYIISTISFISAYLFLFLRMYKLRAFYVTSFLLFLIGIANYYFNRIELVLPDPKKYAAAYIVFGTLIGIGISISFIYAFSSEEE